MAIPVIDLFAGPGGLNEGFSSIFSRGERVFETLASFEMDAAACQTLTLREAYRKLDLVGEGHGLYFDLVTGRKSLRDLMGHAAFRGAWELAAQHVHKLELGPKTRHHSDGVIGAALSARGIGDDDPWVLVGGPPCQAYSLAGRSRRVNDTKFEEDKKHFLYREYLHILSRFRPPFFVMENVKGILSSQHSGSGIFERILRDLSSPARGLDYSIHSLSVAGDPSSLEPQDYVIRAEDYGVPQRRHRVILLGIRNDLGLAGAPILRRRPSTTVRDAIGALPPLRSGISKGGDDLGRWLEIRASAEAQTGRVARGRPRTRLDRGSEWVAASEFPVGKSDLELWLRDPRLTGFAHHATRQHMPEDLLRYWFAASYALRCGQSPKLGDFPTSLLPKHANASAEVRPFEDRFRVQLWDRPSTTVVSHIAKDGHYYIHPDPDQMRSLTVREAARLQTFPDNYFFMGNRTSQFVQVGNAVPPMLAHQIAQVVAAISANAV